MLHKAPRLPVRLRPCCARGASLALWTWLAGANVAAAAETVASARYTDPTDRYAHAVLGDDIEYGGLEMMIGETSSTQIVRLTPDRVFEDIEPRLVDVDLDGTNEVIVVETSVTEGAQLAIYDARGKKIAATPHIGTRNRWLAPAGAADLDGDGHVEIAYVDRPHLAKTLRIWRFKDGQLSEIASLRDLTNHKIGEDFISGGMRTCGSRPELILASADWSRIISVSYDQDWQTRDLGPLTDRNALSSALKC